MALTDRLPSTSIPALAVGVSRDGDREFARGGPATITEASPYRIASLTKLLTSAAIVRAMGERNLPLPTPAAELLPALTDDWRADRSITVEQLLSQVAGLRESVDAAAVAGVGDRPDVLLEVARLVVRAGSERPPGYRWSYYNGNYFLAGAVLAAITGKSFEEAVGQTVLLPWQLTGTGFATPTEPVTGWDGRRELPVEDYPRGRRPSGGLWSCVADLLTFAEHLLGPGDAALMAEVRRPRTRPEDPMAYGLGWALGPSGQMYANGRLAGYRTAMLLVPDRGYASVALANQTRALPEVARLLSELQLPLTRDNLAGEIDAFAA